MVIYKYRCYAGPRTRSPHRHQPQRLYTPSLDAYQRFERAMVGLDVSPPEEGQTGVARAFKVYERRKRG
jgi:hypothetical protein